MISPPRDIILNVIPEYVINIKETDITISIPSEVNIALLKSKNIISIINMIIKPVMMFDDTAFYFFQSKH